MVNLFYIDNIFKELNFTLPIFKHPSNYVMKANVSNVKLNEVNISINFFNDKNQALNFYNVNKSFISFFIKSYNEFVSSGKYTTSKGFFKLRQLNLGLIQNMIKNKEFSIFAFSAKSDLPDLFFDRICTFDGSNGILFAETRISGGKMENIFYTNRQNIHLCYFHILNVKMILNIYLSEKQQLLEIFNTFLSIIKYAIYLIFAIGNIYNIIYNIMNPQTLIWDIIWAIVGIIVSVIGAPLTNFLIKKLINYIIRKNIYSFFSKDYKKWEFFNFKRFQKLFK